MLLRASRPFGLLVLIAVLGGRPALAQVGSRSATSSLTLTATKNTQMSVTIVSGAALTLPSITDNALNTFPAGVTLRTRWALLPLFTNGVSLVAYFTSPATALANGPAVIPSSRVLGRLNADPFQPIAGAPVGGVGTAGGSLELFNVDFGFLNLFNFLGDRTDVLNVQLDLRGAPRTRAGDYVGTLNIRAIAL